jgi:HSP20 family molecular chaperone IbpA
MVSCDVSWPGLDARIIGVTVDDDTLAIEGELPSDVPDGAEAVWQEVGSAKFLRALRLGAAVDSARLEARSETGC